MIEVFNIDTKSTEKITLSCYFLDISACADIVNLSYFDSLRHTITLAKSNYFDGGAMCAIVKWVTNTLLIAGFVLTMPQAVSQTEVSPGDASKSKNVQALLISINKYGEAGLPELYGPPNDIALIQSVLINRFKVPAGNIKILRNPNHEVLRDEFSALASRINRNDQVYIHYSGHGSVATDKLDRRGWDQTWVSYGARNKAIKGVNQVDVLDKEIAVWLQPIYTLTEDVVFVSDSCNSASVSRGFQNKGVRSVRSDPQVHPLLGKLPKAPAPSVGLRIGAARDFEPAVELDQRTGGSCEDNKYCYGLFTWYWAKSLAESRPGESWGDVFQRANAKIITIPSASQRPQMEGRPNRAVFGGHFSPFSQEVEITEVRGDSTVILNAGAINGVTVGSQYQSNSNASKAVLRITLVKSSTSEAIIVSGAILAGDTVTESVHLYSTPKIQLGVLTVDMLDGENWLTRIHSEFNDTESSNLSGFIVNTSPKDADWILTLIRPKPSKKSVSNVDEAKQLPPSFKCTAHCPPPQLWVVSRQGMLLDQNMHFDLANFQSEMARLKNNLRLLAWSREVRGLAVHGNNTKVKAKISIYRPPQPGLTCESSQSPGSNWTHFGPYSMQDSAIPAKFGDCLSFQIDNQDNEHTWYGYIVAVGPDYAVRTVLPKPEANSDEARIQPGESLKEDKLFYRLNQTGKETIILFVSDSPFNAHSLNQGGSRGVSNSALESILAAASKGKGEVESISEWGAISKEFFIKKN